MLIQASPRSISGKVICVPKKLPVEIFKLKWADLEQPDKEALLADAKTYTTSRLQLQKEKSGVAILGSPQEDIKRDPKVSRIEPDSIAVGEDLAWASLIGEALILKRSRDS